MSCIGWQKFPGCPLFWNTLSGLAGLKNTALKLLLSPLEPGAANRDYRGPGMSRKGPQIQGLECPVSCGVVLKVFLAEEAVGADSDRGKKGGGDSHTQDKKRGGRQWL